jgi:hypothetical protein
VEGELLQCLQGVEETFPGRLAALAEVDAAGGRLQPAALHVAGDEVAGVAVGAQPSAGNESGITQYLKKPV